MSDYRNLEVWKKSRALVAEVYRETERFPRSEVFGMTSQMRRAAVGIVLNIAEGNGRWTMRDRRAFIINARASAPEARSAHPGLSEGEREADLHPWSVLILQRPESSGGVSKRAKAAKLDT